ncbi:MAG: choice-of-anchor A family protein [Kiritimatiellia bacterium]
MAATGGFVGHYRAILRSGHSDFFARAAFRDFQPELSLTKTGTIVYNTIIDCDVFGPAVPFNALIFGNFTAVGGDTENRLAIGGNAHFSGGYSVGIPLYGNPIPTYYGDAVDMLIVGGDLHDQQWGVNGNIVYGGTRYGPERRMTNGNIVRHVTPVTFDANGNVPEDGSGMTFAELQARMVARSDQLGALPDRGVVGMVLITPHHMQLIGDDPKLNVFNLTVPPTGISNSQIDIIAPHGSTVLLNIRGEVVRYANGMITLAGVNRERVLYNYVDATRLEITKFTHEGSVLAPRLTSATLIGGSVEGQAVLGGNIVTHTGYEFHNYPFEGSICVESDVFESHIVYNFSLHNSGPVPLTDVTVSDNLVTVSGGPITLAPDATDDTTFSGVYLLTAEDLERGSFSNSATASGRAPGGSLVTAEDYDVRLLAQPGPYIHTENGSGMRLRAGAPNPIVMFYAGIYKGVPADWWVVALAQQGDLWYYLDAEGQWIDVPAGDFAALRPALQGPLYNVLSPTAILPPGLIMPTGTHTLIFAVDEMDGILNYPEGPILIDSTEITVTN